MSGRSVKCFSECAQRTHCIPIPVDWDVGSDLWGWSLGLCILTPSLVTLIHSRATGALVIGGRGGGGQRERNLEGSCHKWSEVRGREREVPGHRKVLTTSSLPSSFSHEPSQPGLTPPPGVGCREKLPERGKCVLMLTMGLSGLPCRRKDRSQGNRSKGAVGTWRDHPDPLEESG